MKIKRFFNVSIRADALAKIWNWVHLCDKEISGLGTVEVIGNSYVVDEVYLYKQYVTGSETELDSAAVSSFMQSISEKKRRRLRFWWHSHVNMGVFWSSTDEECVKTLLQDDYIISTVFNKKGENLTRVDIKKDWPLTLDNLSYGIEKPNIISEMEAKDYIGDVFPIKDIEEYKSKKNIIELLGDPVSLYREVYKDFCEKEFKEKVNKKQYNYIGFLHERRSTTPPARSYLSIIPRQLGL